MDKLGEEVNNYIDKLQDDIAIYLKDIENELLDSFEYLELKVNNYLVSIKEDIIYRFCKYLQDKEFEIDAIEMYKNKLNTKLEEIEVKLVDNKYYGLKESFNDQILDLNTEVDKLIDIKTKLCSRIDSMSIIDKLCNIDREDINQAGTSLKQKNNQVEKSLKEKINQFEISLRENLGISKISYVLIKSDLDKRLNGSDINVKILKRNYKRKFELIQEDINERITSEIKVEISKAVNNALQTTIDTLKEEINNINQNNSYKEDSYENLYSNESKYNKIKRAEYYEIIESEKINKTYKEKEEIKNILITTSLGREIYISIDECKTNMSEITFNRTMAAINKLIDQYK